MEAFVIIGIIMLLALLWINFLAMLSIKYDSTLGRFQKVGQSLFVWLIPYVGASLVLKFVFEHSPEAIPKSWVPWPLKKMIFGKEINPNKNRDEVENDTYYNRKKSDSYERNRDGGD